MAENLAIQKPCLRGTLNSHHAVQFADNKLKLRFVKL